MIRPRQTLTALALLIAGSAGAVSCSENPDGLPHFATLRPETWEAAAFSSTGLARWLDSARGELPLPCRLIVYRRDCGVCAQHLDALPREPGRVPLVLLQVPDPGDEAAEIDARTWAPRDHLHLGLVPLERGYGFTAPAEAFVDATGTLRQVRDAATIASDL